MSDLLARIASASGIPVGQALRLADGYVVSLDYYASSRTKLWGNLFRVRDDGSRAWELEAPRLPDVFVKIEIQNGKLTAWTWSGYRHSVDIDSGQIEQSVFVK
jgi:hypothetical protein